MPLGSRLHHADQRAVVRTVRILACFAGVVTTLFAAFVCAERTYQIWLVAGGVAAAWIGYFGLCWHRPPALLVPVSWLICLLVFMAIVEPSPKVLLKVEQWLGIQIFNPNPAALA